jgi:hypothetical protein
MPHGIPKNLANFLLRAAAVSPRAALQLFFTSSSSWRTTS